MSRTLLFIFAIFGSYFELSLADSDIYFTNSVADCSLTKKKSLEEINHIALKSTIDICQLTHFSYDNLRVLRNTIHAHHGRTFKTPDLIEYFNKTSWYKNNPNFKYDLLTDNQSKNVKTIKLVEDLIKAKKKIKKDSYDDDMFGYNFKSIHKFLSPINKLNKKHKSISIQNNTLVFSGTENKIDIIQKTEKELKPMDQVNGNLSWYIIENKVLVFYPYSFVGIDIYGCSSKIFSLKGEKLKEYDFCPNYYFKQNKNLLINIADTGISGAIEYDIDIVDTINNTIHDYSCAEPDCIGVLFTDIPSSKTFMLSMFTGHSGNNSWNKNEIIFFDYSGKIQAIGNIIDIYVNPDKTTQKTDFLYNLYNMIDVAYFKYKNKWLIKFQKNGVSNYLLINSEKKQTPSKTGFLIRTQHAQDGNLQATIYINGKKKGVTPYREYMYPGFYTIKLMKKGYIDKKIEVEIHEDKISSRWPYMQKTKKNK